MLPPFPLTGCGAAAADLGGWAPVSGLHDAARRLQTSARRRQVDPAAARHWGTPIGDECREAPLSAHCFRARVLTAAAIPATAAAPLPAVPPSRQISERTKVGCLRPQFYSLHCASTCIETRMGNRLG
jgi:hypothetical protein